MTSVSMLRQHACGSSALRTHLPHVYQDIFTRRRYQRHRCRGKKIQRQIQQLSVAEMCLQKQSCRVVTRNARWWVVQVGATNGAKHSSWRVPSHGWSTCQHACHFCGHAWGRPLRGPLCNEGVGRVVHLQPIDCWLVWFSIYAARRLGWPHISRPWLDMMHNVIRSKPAVSS